ncbi:cytidylyltransferase domain-containing protein [Natronomonas sp. EA1]|uniref:cytidylyltransferase domain-containing protein n=1 Tax=Natronomonas sp. EA1 TaxID=3421655 RepID=UPI003EB99DD2
MGGHTVAIIQARMGSTRLPGKVLLQLGDEFALNHVIRRVKNAKEIDQVVVATSDKSADDILKWCGENNEVPVFRGNETNVLLRMYDAAECVGADEVVRVTGDCPLIDPRVLDAVVRQRRKADADYASNILDRTFPRGLDVEAFTLESLQRVYEEATEAAHLEHVTLYYRDNPGVFELSNVASQEVFENDELRGRTDLRLTLDEAADYLLLREIFERVDYSITPEFADVVAYIDEHGLADMNESVSQKAAHDASRN